MGYDTDRLLQMDELTIETAKLIRTGMDSQKAIEKARVVIREKHIITSSYSGAEKHAR